MQFGQLTGYEQPEIRAAMFGSRLCIGLLKPAEQATHLLRHESLACVSSIKFQIQRFTFAPFWRCEHVGTRSSKWYETQVACVNRRWLEWCAEDYVDAFSIGMLRKFDGVCEKVDEHLMVLAQNNMAQYEI
jgi:hypothetical protein